MTTDPASNPTLRVLNERASCRNFSDQPVPPDLLQAVIEAGLSAPTAGNLQPYSVIVVEDPDTRQELAQLCDEQLWMAHAPVHLIFCIDWHRTHRWAELEDAPFTANQAFRHFWVSFEDTTIFAHSVCVAAEAFGLGTVYVGTAMDEAPALREMLHLPREVMPTVLLCLGYPKTTPTQRRKLGIEIVAHIGRYRELRDQTLLNAFEQKHPDARFEATPERLETIRQVCLDSHGPDFAERCLARIEEQGYINQAQQYFTLRYAANDRPTHNQEHLDFMAEIGFGWFKPFHLRTLDGEETT